MFRRSLLLLPLLTLPLGLLVAHFPSGAQAASNFQNVPAATANIHLALLFNYNLPNKTVETGKVDYVWGAQAKINTVATNNPAPTVAHTYYTMFTEANEAESLTWFQTNHPDWLVYKCDRTSIAMVGNQIPLDVTNPAVQSFELNAITQAMDGGYQGVGFDNTSTYNFFGKCGHYDTSGSWVQQFSGTHYDTAYRTATTTAFHQLTDQVRAAAAARNIPFYITINGGPNLWENQAAWYDLLPYLDFVVDEDGFTNGGYSTHNRLTSDATDTVGNAWLTKMQEFQYLQNTLGKGLVIAAQEPYQVTAIHAPSAGDLEWVLANYLMARSSHTYQVPLSGNQQYGGMLTSDPAYRVAIGTPTSAMYPAQGVYVRNYSNGLVIINPSSTTSHAVTLPAGTFHTLTGQGVTGAVTLPAGGSATVLLGTSTSVPQATSVKQTSQSISLGRQLVRNHSFAGGLRYWQSGSTAHYSVVSEASHASIRGADLCGFARCNTHLQQTVKLPVKFERVVLSYTVRVQTGRNGAVGHDRLLVQLKNTTGAPIVTYHINSTGKSHQAHRTVQLALALAAYHGQSIKVSLHALTGTGHTRFTVTGITLRITATHA